MCVPGGKTVRVHAFSRGVRGCVSAIDLPAFANVRPEQHRIRAKRKPHVDDPDVGRGPGALHCFAHVAGIHMREIVCAVARAMNVGQQRVHVHRDMPRNGEYTKSGDEYIARARAHAGGKLRSLVNS